MKNIAIIICSIILLSCHNTHAVSARNFEQYAPTAQAADTFIHSLQQKNELLISMAVETNAWARTAKYRIMALNNNEWKGYIYAVNKTGGRTAVKTTEVAIIAKECDAVWKYIQSVQAWKIKGDANGNFCTGSQQQNCTINDGATWRLQVLTKTNISDAAFYEPYFYDECCPGNSDRKLFITTIDRIQNTVKDPPDGSTR